MSGTQHVLGLMLDFGVTSDKALSTLSNCNIVSAPQTLYKKKDIAVLVCDKTTDQQAMASTILFWPVHSVMYRPEW